MLRIGFRALLGGVFLLPLLAGGAMAQTCVGDCKGHNDVDLDDVVTSIRIALAEDPLARCPAAAAGGDSVMVDDLVQIVDNYLLGCAPRTPVATATQGPILPTPTATPEGEACPMEPGLYTVTQVAGGELALSGLAPFPFPAGGYIREDVGAATAPACVHPVVVGFNPECDPFTPGSCDFYAPAFCSVAAFNFTTMIRQIGCGVGRIDSNGGSDFTVSELGDTSAKVSCPCDQETDPTCPAVSGGCAFGDNNDVRVDVTLGDGTPDTCAGTGTANSIVSIPVHTITWLDNVNFDCPDKDGRFDPEAGDTLIVEFDQFLDFTTDKADAAWQDLDGDSCFVAVNGSPTSRPPLSESGACLDLDSGTITTAGAGTIGSSGGPLYDLSFTSRLPSVVTGPEPATGATCANPPGIDLDGGTVTRCIH